MNQSTLIFGYIAVAFLIFITQRGELPIYWGFLVSTPKQPAAGPQATASGSVSGGTATDMAKAVSTITTIANELGPAAVLL